MPWFEPPSKGGCRDNFLFVAGVFAVCVFVVAVMRVGELTQGTTP